MDFREKLPNSQGKTVIMVVVDRLSKYAHFMPLSHPFNANQVAQVFLDGVYKLHGLPESIVSDRDKSDGKTEVVNRCLGCMCGEKPKEWVKWLPLAEFWYNTNFHSAINTTPYETVYCQTPPIHIPYVPGDSRVESVDRTLQSREEAINMLNFYMKRAQDRMKSQADKHRTDRELEVGQLKKQLGKFMLMCWLGFLSLMRALGQANSQGGFRRKQDRESRYPDMKIIVSVRMVTVVISGSDSEDSDIFMDDEEKLDRGCRCGLAEFKETTQILGVECQQYAQLRDLLYGSEREESNSIVKIEVEPPEDPDIGPKQWDSIPCAYVVIESEKQGFMEVVPLTA
ncbi:reverse transcriptase [Tanacetum coccineum]